MKLGISLAAIPIIIANIDSFSQESPNRINKFHIGFTSSINTAFVESSSETIPKIGFKVGGIIRYDLWKRFSLVGGMSYGNRKIKIQSSGLVSDGSSQPEAIYSADESHSYIELPIGINFVFNPKSSTKFFWGLELSTRRLLSAKRSFTFTRVTGNSITGSDFSISTTLNDWSLFGSTSAGIQIPTGNNQSLSFTISIDQNFSKIVRDPNYNPNYDNVITDYKIFTLGLNATYLFN